LVDTGGSSKASLRSAWALQDEEGALKEMKKQETIRDVYFEGHLCHQGEYNHSDDRSFAGLE
jgi:hypothetical protein